MESRKASNEVNALCRLKSFLKQYGKILLQTALFIVVSTNVKYYAIFSHKDQRNKYKI